MVYLAGRILERRNRQRQFFLGELNFSLNGKVTVNSYSCCVRSGKLVHHQYDGI